MNSLSYMKKTPLYFAVENGHTELAKWISERFEVDVNIACEASDKTALFTACEKGYTEIVAALIRRADI